MRSAATQPKAIATCGSICFLMAWASIGWILIEEVEAVLHPEQPEGTERHRRHQNETLEQRLPQRVEVEDEEKIANGAKHQRPEDCADGRSRSAEKRDAAQHNRSNRIERVGAAIRRRGLAGIGDQSEEQTAH